MLRSLSPGVYPEDSRLNLELSFNHFHPFRKAWIMYLLAFILMLMATREGKGLRRSLYWPAFACYLVGLGIQIYGKK